VIQGYTARVNPKALGLPLAVWLRVRPLPGQLRKVAEFLQELPEIVECDRITGEDCFIARAYVRSVEDLERLIDTIIPYATTNTSIIQSSPVERRACFDRISHEWLLKNVPMDKVILSKWLKAGFIDKYVFYPTDEGVPQGGITTPLTMLQKV
jgi:DNA-binding Lrp family transcriptional regulator